VAIALLNMGPSLQPALTWQGSSISRQTDSCRPSLITGRRPWPSSLGELCSNRPRCRVLFRRVRPSFQDSPYEQNSEAVRGKFSGEFEDKLIAVGVALKSAT
jgi:hypothetical protein